MTDALVLSTRTLNRTLLQRQFLTARTSRPALDVVEHLVALQGQEPNWPYVGLWTRLAGFRHDDLTALLRDGRVVRSAALRSTQHLTSGNDFRWLRPALQPVLDRTARARYFAAQTAGLSIAELTDAGRELTAGHILPRRGSPCRSPSASRAATAACSRGRWSCGYRWCTPRSPAPGAPGATGPTSPSPSRRTGSADRWQRHASRR